MQPTVQIQGMEALIKNCERIRKEAQERFKKVVLQNAYEVERDAKQMCPVDTGRLRGSLSVNWSNSGMNRGRTENPATGDDGVGRPEFGKADFLAAVGTNVEYADYVEHWRPYLWTAFFTNVNWKYFENKIKIAMESVK